MEERTFRRPSQQVERFSERPWERQESTMAGFSLPRLFQARGKLEDYQVQFYETVAVPESALEEITFEEVDEELLRALSQWRVDFPIHTGFPLNEREIQVLAVVEKILLRGRITLISPTLEESFSRMFRPDARGSFVAGLLELPSINYRMEELPNLWVDSEEEGIFYRELLPEVLGSNYWRFVHPQVELASLLPEEAHYSAFSGQRVDFVIMRPKEENIVVEIDGAQHQGSLADAERDEALKTWGYVVVRIPAAEVRERKGKQLSYLFSLLKKSEEPKVSPKATTRFLLALKVAHQIQVALLLAVRFGFLDPVNLSSWQVVTDLQRLGIFKEEEALFIGEQAVADFVELFRRTRKLYGLSTPEGNPRVALFNPDGAFSGNSVFLSFAQIPGGSINTFFIQDIYLSFSIAHPSLSARASVFPVKQPEREELEYFLRYIFRKTSFREGQYEGVSRILQGKDVLLLLPTGAGKSLVYQLASFLLPGVTVVIDPLIALMEDQIDNLALGGVDRCIAVTSQIESPAKRQKVLQLIGQGEYLFVFIAPERFQTLEFRESMRTLTVHTPVALIVVDEAHCISEWGHDFRVAYLNIGRTSREYCRSGNRIPPLVALTGTASRAVLKDIQRELQIVDFEAVITPRTFDREELRFQVFHASSQEKMAILKGYLGRTLPEIFNLTPTSFFQLRGHETHAGLVFCPHVDGSLGVRQVAEEIGKDLRVSLDVYSGREPKHQESSRWLRHKKRVTKSFKRNKLSLLVCTKAFGMGIDKPNIRYTVHIGLPPSIEAFYQEAGRAGRDRKTAHCSIIVSIDNPKRAEQLLNPATGVEEIGRVIRSVKWEDNDDVTRMLYFHVRAFRGIAEEMKHVTMVLKQIPDLKNRTLQVLSIPKEIKSRYQEDGDRSSREIIEKAIYRLLLIGVISDYTINYATWEFTVQVSGATKEEIVETYGRYVAGYLSSRRRVEMGKASQFLHLEYREFVLKVVELLLHFLYEVIEKGRRRAFYEMLLACRDTQGDRDFRARILRYLETTQYSETLEELVRDERGGFTQAMDTFDVLNSLREVAELRGQVSRYLESYPDHPALLMLRALTEVLSGDGNREVARQNFAAALSSAFKSYGMAESLIFDFALWAITKVYAQNVSLARELVRELGIFGDRQFLRLLLEKLPIDLSEEIAWLLLGKLEKQCLQLGRK